jgi:hypothetical protein
MWEKVETHKQQELCRNKTKQTLVSLNTKKRRREKEEYWILHVFNYLSIYTFAMLEWKRSAAS